MRVKPAKLLSPTELADVLGEPWTGQRVRRYVLRRERATGRPIFERIGEGEARATYRASIRTVRRACPELFDRDDETQRAVSAVLGTVRRDIQKVAEQGEIVAQQQGKIANAIGSFAVRARK